MRAGSEGEALLSEQDFTQVQVAAHYINGADPSQNPHNATSDPATQSRLSKLISTSWLRSAAPQPDPAASQDRASARTTVCASPRHAAFPQQPPRWRAQRDAPLSADGSSSCKGGAAPMQVDGTRSTAPATQAMPQAQGASQAGSSSSSQQQQGAGGAPMDAGAADSTSKPVGVRGQGADKLQQASQEKQDTVAEVFGSKLGNPEPLYPAGTGQNEVQITALLSMPGCRVQGAGGCMWC